LIRRVVFRPAALRDFRIVQARIDAALLRYANTGDGDIKALEGCPGEFRLRIGKWRLFFLLQPQTLFRVLAIDNRGEAY
jgi:mRNA interferase RelE/StbE